MDYGSSVKAEIKLVYPDAGIQFIMEIGPGEGGNGDGSGAMLRIVLKDATGEKDLTCDEERSPVLGDFVGGFVRWLGTLGIKAAHSAGEITGSFHPDYNVEGFIKASGAICEMIDQRFSLYRDSVLA